MIEQFKTAVFDESGTPVALYTGDQVQMAWIALNIPSLRPGHAGRKLEGTLYWRVDSALQLPTLAEFDATQ